MRAIIGFVLIGLTAAGPVEATPQAKRSASKAPIKRAPNAVSSRTAVAPVWRPIPFIDTTGNLPADYKGENAWQIYKLMVGFADRVKKDEFETTAQYEARIANSASVMAPLDPNALYAFQLKPEVKYDADAQLYTMGSNYSNECRSKEYGSGGSIQLCTIETHFDDSPDYQGQNAYGATATVRRISGTTISMAVDRTNLPKSLFVKESYLDDLKVSHQFSMPIDKAALLRGKKIALLAVGNITGPKLVEGRGLYSRPTISDPTDMAMSSYGIPFKVRVFIIYVVETGEVLERITA